MIKDELAKEAKGIDDLLTSEGGLPDMVAASFKGSMRRWVWFTWGVMLVVTGFMFWCIYEFFTADDLEGMVFWGICMLVTMLMQSMLKLWNLMEMNRASMMREVKRLELAVAALARKVG